MIRFGNAMFLLFSSMLSGCSVLAVADAAVTVAATTVKVGATVVGTSVEIAGAGVRAMLPEDAPPEAPHPSVP